MVSYFPLARPAGNVEAVCVYKQIWYIYFNIAWESSKGPSQVFHVISGTKHKDKQWSHCVDMLLIWFARTLVAMKMLSIWEYLDNQHNFTNTHIITLWSEILMIELISCYDIPMNGNGRNCLPGPMWKSVHFIRAVDSQSIVSSDLIAFSTYSLLAWLSSPILIADHQQWPIQTVRIVDTAWQESLMSPSLGREGVIT